MLKKRDLEKQGCQIGEMKEIEEKSDLHSLPRRVVEMEDVTLVNNATLYECNQARYGSHILRQVVYVRDRSSCLQQSTE